MENLSPKSRACVILAILVGVFLAALDQTVVATALPRIAASLGHDSGYVLVIATYLITQAVTALVTSRLSDRWGRRKTLFASLGMFLLGSVAAGFAPAMSWLVVARAIQGIGAGGLMAGAFIIISDVVEPRRRGKWFAVTASVFGLAAIIGPILGGAVTDAFGWRWIFFMNIPIGLLAAELARRLLPYIRPGQRGSIDWLGALTITGCVTALVLALSWGGAVCPWASPTIGILLAAAVILGGLFWYIELRSSEPILPVRLLRDRSLALTCVVIVLSAAIFFGAVVYLSVFLQEVQGQSVGGTGLRLLPLVIGLFIGSSVAGRIAHATGRYRTQGIISLVVTIVALDRLSQLSVHTGSYTLAWQMALLGIGLGPGMALWQVVAQNLCPPRERGTITSTTMFMRIMGGAIGMALLGVCFGQHSAAHPNSSAIAHSVGIVFNVCLVLAGLTLALFLLIEDKELRSSNAH